MAFDALGLGATLLGGLLGANGSGSSTQTVSKDPWAPAQPYLLNNLNQLQALQNSYTQTPFNPAQEKYYGQLASDIQNFRDNMPALLQGYQRGDSTKLNLTAPTAVPNSAALNSYFSPMAQSVQNASKTADNAVSQVRGLLTSPETHGHGGEVGLGNGVNGDDGQGGLSGLAVGSGIAAQSLPPGILSGILSMVSDAANAINNTGYGSVSGDAEGTATGHSTGSNPDNPNAGQAGGDGTGFAKGGMVKKGLLSGPDPKGPDEGKANLQSGEYVIRKKAVQAIGKKKLDELNRKG